MHAKLLIYLQLMFLKITFKNVDIFNHQNKNSILSTTKLLECVHWYKSSVTHRIIIFIFLFTKTWFHN